MKHISWISRLWGSKQHQQEVIPTSAPIEPERFDKLMETARRIQAKNPAALPNLIAAILRPEQSELLLGVAERGQDAADDVSGYTFFFDGLLELAHCEGRSPRELDPRAHPLDLTRDCLLPCPWDEDRLSDAIAFIGRGKVDQSEAERNQSLGNWRQDRNHVVHLWLPWRIGIVLRGNHSIAAGILAGDGHLFPEAVHDFDYLFDLIECDGRTYRYGDNLEHTGPVTDVRHAAVFEIGRMIAR